MVKHKKFYLKIQFFYTFKLDDSLTKQCSWILALLLKMLGIILKFYSILYFSDTVVMESEGGSPCHKGNEDAAPVGSYTCHPNTSICLGKNIQWNHWKYTKHCKNTNVCYTRHCRSKNSQAKSNYSQTAFSLKIIFFFFFSHSPTPGD